VIGIPLGLLAANAGEWLIHKHILHGLGANPRSFWSFHWHEHHRNARRMEGLDPCYHRGLLGWNAQSKEALGLAGAALLVLPLAPIAPFFTGAVIWSIVDYHRKHKRAHLDPAWARVHLPWHYDHHLGPDQHTNWCVTRPWFDRLLGTRVPYVGTPREARDRTKRAARAAERGAPRA
jgi:sterol desaturase/sphingolipid hydroxylase (fatty acid hydroxylase superfamily)